MPPPPTDAERRSLKPTLRFWLVAIALAVACVAFFWLTGLAGKAVGAIASDLLGMAGSLMLLYATAQSLPARERLARLTTLSRLANDKVIAEINKNFQVEESEISQEHLEREWRLAIWGAGMLCASFGISMSEAFLRL